MELGEEPEYSVDNEIHNNKSSNKVKVLHDGKEECDRPRLPQSSTKVSNEKIDHTENMKPKTTRRRKLIIIKIKDKGKGIDEKIYPKLFEKFATGGNNNTGLGLGLYISKWILDFHKGKIWAENNKNESGATFSISLPLQNQ